MMTSLEHNITSFMRGHIELCPRSHIRTEEGELMLFRADGNRFLAVQGDLTERFGGRAFGGLKIGLPDHENRMVLGEVLPWTRPQAFGADCASFGFGDGVGYANPPQLRAIRGTGIRPVLAQQSVRELRLAHRQLRDVLDTAAWAVLEEGYREGYGCDADHLATKEEIRDAVEIGCTMVTLDYVRIAKAGPPERFIAEIYRSILAPAGRSIDIEISLNDAQEPTTAREHAQIAGQLRDLGVPVTSLAPKLVGAFLPGQEYRGDLGKLRAHLRDHQRIAEAFGHRLSLHRASNKLKVLRILAEETGGRYHVKTMGASWIQALRTMQAYDPDLYQCMHEKALSDPALKGKIQKFLQDHRAAYGTGIEGLYRTHIDQLVCRQNPG